VVCKLLRITAPHQAFFGEKDYQQLVLVHQMSTDLNLGVRIVGVPTVREADGLALSSRNTYLSAEQRRLATTLSAALTAGAHAAEQGAEAVLSTARAVLEAVPELEVDYLELRSTGLGPAPEEGDGRLLVAARLGGTRLLDNVGVPIGTGFKAYEDDHGGDHGADQAPAVAGEPGAVGGPAPAGESGQPAATP